MSVKVGLGNGSEYEPKVTIKEDVNALAFNLVFYGGFTLVAILAIVIPFFRYLLTFTSVIVAIILGFAMMAAKDDRDAKVKRKKPRMNYKTPVWLPHAFFSFMIVVSAGLRLGWYLVPVCWLASWVFSYSARDHVRATYIDESADTKT